jgi:pimeloyl-ACP methyl ester carboxylesterase
MSVIIDGMRVTEHIVTVPLDWSAPDDCVISVSVREVVAVGKENDNLAPLCFFTGGPGFQALAPISKSGWLAENLARYRVFLLDQRGTGRSTPVDAAIAVGRSDTELADYLAMFRADSVVRDAEHIRKTLLGEDVLWTIQGQSFGGFCALTYLSLFPQSVKAVIITGGFAPVLHPAIEVFNALKEGLIERNDAYYKQFPEDLASVRLILDHLTDGSVLVAPNWRLTARQFLTLGYKFGAKLGPATVHEIVDRAVRDIETIGTLSRWAIANASDPMWLSTNPIYAAVHEVIYCSSMSPLFSPAQWAAQTAIAADSRFNDSEFPCFTGEMIFPWMFDELPTLAPFKGAAEILAQKIDWPDLYNLVALRSNEVPVVGTIYFDDFYVYRDFALETAKLIGNCGYWVTNEYEHGGYSDDPKRVMGRLFEMLEERSAAS